MKKLLTPSHSAFSSYAPCVIVALVAFALTACHSSHHHEHDHDAEIHETEEHDEHVHSADAIILEPEKAAAAGVCVEQAARGTFHDVILASGQIVEASCDEMNIVATVSGVVTHTRHISEGSAVQHGAVLYHINSSEMRDGDQTQHAYIAFERATKEWERAQALMADGLITERDYNAIRADYETAKLSYEAVGSKRTSRGVAIASPETGYVKACFVTDGDYVEVGQKLMTITRNQHLYLRAEVPMRYYEQIDRIQTAHFKTALSPRLFSLSDLDGQLLSAGKSVSKTYSYIPVTFEFDNCGGIVPGSIAEVFLIAGERADVLTLPKTALTEEQGLFFVYCQDDEDCYSKHEVLVGATDGERVEIISGLTGGERVVVAGVMNVKLAGASKAVPGHTHNH